MIDYGKCCPRFRKGLGRWLMMSRARLTWRPAWRRASSPSCARSPKGWRTWPGSASAACRAGLWSLPVGPGLGPAIGCRYTIED